MLKTTNFTENIREIADNSDDILLCGIQTNPFLQQSILVTVCLYFALVQVSQFVKRVSFLTSFVYPTGNVMQDVSSHVGISVLLISDFKLDSAIKFVFPHDWIAFDDI